MMYYQFSMPLAGALSVGQSEALSREHLELDIGHLLFGFASNPQCKSHKFFKKIKSKIENYLDLLPHSSGGKQDILKMQPNAKLAELLTKASANAIQDGRQAVTEDDFLKLLPRQIGKLEIPAIENPEQDSLDSENKRPDFLVDLNERAAKGKLDPVIGRKNEIRTVMEILGRRSKNNPVLLGEAGVGKTAIVEGIAELIVQKKAPDNLKDKTILSLDMASLMTGTKYRGEFEERINKLIQYVEKNHREVILFIDEIHLLVGAGKTEGSMDAANLLKPALARGELNCIGATTHREYKKFIRDDSALDRRFRGVKIDEPSPEEAIEILIGLKEKFEIHHGIDIQDDAIFSAVYLSSKYMMDKFLPDKAIDLIDEGASALKLSAEALPKHLVDIESEIRSKFIFAKTGKASVDINDQIETLQKQFNQEKTQWEQKVFAIKKLSTLKNQLETLRHEEQKAESNQDWEIASEIKYNKIPALERDIKDCPVEWSLGKKEIAKIVSRHTGVSVETLLKTKQKEILKVDQALKNRVYGQDDSIQVIADIIATSHSGLSSPTKPLGSFLLCGPSGVGKTETAKALAEFLFDSDDALLRFDLSEYSQKHSVAKLIGSPAGYVGYHDGGVLTEAVRRKPYCVLLFDEVEKAHEDFADILLQILDDGRLTDNKGQTVNFRNTIIILTTNAQNLDGAFKNEFLGRLDSILYYKMLDDSVMEKLIDKEVDTLNERLVDKKLKVQISKSVRERLVKDGFSKRYGARPLKNTINQMVIRPLARRVLEGDLQKGILEARLDSGGMVHFVDGKYELKAIK